MSQDPTTIGIDPNDPNYRRRRMLGVMAKALGIVPPTGDVTGGDVLGVMNDPGISGRNTRPSDIIRRSSAGTGSGGNMSRGGWEFSRSGGMGRLPSSLNPSPSYQDAVLSAPATNAPPVLQRNPAATTSPMAGIAQPPAPSPQPMVPPPSGANQPVPDYVPGRDIAPTKPVRISYSTAGLQGADKIGQLREAQANESARSALHETPEGITVDAPDQRRGLKGRLKSIGQGLLLGLASGDPEHPASILGSAIGGGLLGGISPSSEQRLARRFQQARTDSDYARQLKLQQEQAKLDTLQLPQRGQISDRVVSAGEYPGVDAGTTIQTQVDPRTGTVTDVLRGGRPVVHKLPTEPAGRAPHYDKDSQGYLITVQDGRSKRVLDEQGQPVKSDSKQTIPVTLSDGTVVQATPGEAITADAGRVKIGEAKQQADAEAEADNKALGDLTSNIQILEGNAQTAEATAVRLEQEAQSQLDDSTRQAIAAGILPTPKNPDAERERQRAEKFRQDAQQLRIQMGPLQQKINARGAKGTSAKPAAKSGPTLEGAINAFKSRTHRDPTDKELANIKAHYGFQ